jgi:D-alanyl-D-alanine dipeptidase
MDSRFLFLFAIILFARCTQQNDSKNKGMEDIFGLQKIVVTTESWSDTKGKMILMERADLASKWTTIASFDILVGRSGLARDEANLLNTNDTTPIKREGDGCAPAGVFSLGKIFSYHFVTGLKMPFQQVDANNLCIDDTNSKYYNTLVNDSLIIDKDYASFEYMRRNDHQYEYGVWVNYNTNPQVSGRGSCIFLHIYKDSETPTSGCTAMSKEDMLELIYWLDENKKPMLVQGVKVNLTN